MSLIGKIFKLPANRQRAHDEYFKVERENFGILVCTMLVPDRPHHKITNLVVILQNFRMQKKSLLRST